MLAGDAFAGAAATPTIPSTNIIMTIAEIAGISKNNVC